MFASQRHVIPGLAALQGSLGRLPKQPGSAPGSARFFAKRRKRLDEYDHYERPLSAKSWKRLRFEGDFFEHSFQDMTPGEVSNSVFLASKMDVQNDAFWSRAALGVSDVASAMTARQLTAACYGFGAQSWHDDALVKSLASPLVNLAPEMKATHLATAAQALARMKVRHLPVLAAFSAAASESLAAGRLRGKGVAMMTKAFAELEFHCPRFLSALDAWASAGVANTRLDVCLDLFHSLSLLAPKPPPSPYPQPVAAVAAKAPPMPALRPAAMALAESLALRIKELEAPQLHTVVLAMGKLCVDDLEVVRQVQKEVLAELSALQSNSLPPVLESFAVCFQALATNGKDTLDPEILQERETFLLQLTGRLARELRVLRPQEASRLLQAIDRLGLVDPRLLGMAAELVPQRLGKWRKEDLLALLEAYAAAENVDHFMVPMLRRALVPLPEAALEDERQRLDDMQMVKAAEAFLSLNHPSGLVALLTLRRPWADGFTPSCQLALAFLAANLDEATWEEARSRILEKATKDAALDGARSMAALSEALAEQIPLWLSAAEVTRYQADDLLLAVLAFPKHLSISQWYGALEQQISQCSLGLLPGLLLRLEAVEASASPASPASPLSASLGRAAAAELLQRLCRQNHEVEEMPAMAVVACFKALAKIHQKKGRMSQEVGNGSLSQALMDSMDPLLKRLAVLKDQDQLPAKASVRVLQSLQVMGLEPPSLLVISLAESAGRGLSPVELLAALRPLTPKSIKLSGGRSLLSAAATRAMGQLKSSRQAWELDGLCKALKIEVGEVMPDEELFKEEVAQAQTG